MSIMRPIKFFAHDVGDGKITERYDIYTWGTPRVGEIILLNILEGRPVREGGKERAYVVTGIVHVSDAVPPVETQAHAVWLGEDWDQRNLVAPVMKR